MQKTTIYKCKEAIKLGNNQSPTNIGMVKR